jgi:uncharacterized protein with GYD domain
LPGRSWPNRRSTRPTWSTLVYYLNGIVEQAKLGINNLGTYWMFARYDAVRIFEAPDEKTAMKGLMMAPDRVVTETLVAMRREDAQRLLE